MNKPLNLDLLSDFDADIESSFLLRLFLPFCFDSFDIL